VQEQVVQGSIRPFTVASIKRNVHDKLPMKKLLFWKKMLCSGNMMLCRLAKCCDATMFALAAKYHIEPHDAVRSSVARIKDSFWFYFSELV